MDNADKTTSAANQRVVMQADSIISNPIITSHPHPEPCTAIVAALNLSLKFSNEPKSLFIASISSPSFENKNI
jgi:hypothetical protein